jgi:nicotinamidase-related amidase
MRDADPAPVAPRRLATGWRASRYHVAMSAPPITRDRSRVPDRNPSALLDRDDSMVFVVDLQEGFLRKLTTAERERLVATARFVIEVARRLGIPFFVTVEEPTIHGPTLPAIRACLPQEAPDQDKRVFGLCGQPDLRLAALASPRRTAVLIGLETDVCVLHSAVGLRAQGFRAVIIADATGAPGDEHDLGLARARLLGIEVLHAKGLYYEWLRSLDALVAVNDIAPPPATGL